MNVFFRSNISRLFLLAGFCATGAWADQIVLKNGDKITGAIVKKDGKTITIKSDKFGVVTADWDQVASITSDKPLNIVFKNDKVAKGTLSNENDKVLVTSGGTSFSLPAGEVVSIRDDAEQKAFDRLQHPGWGELWSGTGTVGFAGTSGNAKTVTFTTALAAARITNTDKTSVYFNAVKASATVSGKSAETAKAVRGGIGYDHNVSSKLFVNLFNDYEYDRFQNLDLRFVAGGGLGYHAAKTEKSRLDVVAGGAFNHSSFATPLTTNSGEVYFGDEYSYKLNGASSLVQSFRMFNNLSDTGTYRVNFDLGIATKLTSWLTWNVALSDRYLNHPAPGRKTNDLLYTTGLGVTFSR